MVEGKKYGLLNSTAQSVRSKLIITFLFIAIIPLCLLTGFNITHVTNILQKNASPELRKVSATASTLANAWFEDRITELYFFKSQLSNLPIEQKKQIEYFVSHFDFVNNIEIVIAPALKQPFVSSYGQINKGELSKLINSLDTSPATFGSVKYNNKQFNIVAMPLLNSAQQRQGVILAEINFNDFFKSLNALNTIYNDVSFFVVDNTKTKHALITHEDNTPAFSQTTLSTKPTFEYTNANGEPNKAFINDLNFLDKDGWRLIVAQPSRDLLTSAAKYKQLALFTSAGLLLVIVFAVWWFSQRLSKPLIKLTSVMARVADGEKICVPTLTESYELNRLSVALQKMVAFKAEQQSMLQKQRMALQTAFKQLDEQKSALDEHAIVAITDLAGTITFVNKKFCEISGYQEHELIGQNHRLLNSGRHDKSFFENMYNTLKKGEVWHGQICNKAKHGGVYWVDTTIAPFFDEHGKPQSYIAIRTDVTPLKLQELELEQHKTQLQLVIDTTAVGIWDWFIDTSKVTFNNRWAEIIGYKLSELEPTTIDTWYKFAHPDDLVISEKKLQAHFNGDTDYYVSEARMRHKDGHWVWVLDTAKVVEWNLDGSPRRMIGTHVDITERKQIESELQSSRDRFASLVANIPGVIYRCKYDKAWTMFYMSAQVKDITGYAPSDFINNKTLSFAQVILDGDRDVELQVSTCIAQKLPWSIEYRIKRKDGSLCWVHERGQAIYGDDDEVLYLDGFISDITERHNTQVEITRQQSLLEAMSKQGQIGAWEINLENQTMYWSDEVKVIHEVPEGFEPNIDTAINFYKPGEHRDKISTLFECAVTLGESWSVELIILTYTGKERWVKSIGQAEFKNGECVRVFGSFQSIDAHKRLELESEKANAYNKNLASLTISPEVQNSDVAQVKKLAIKSMVEVLNVQRASIWMLNEQCDEMACHGLYTQQDGFVDFDGVLEKVNFPNYFKAVFKQNLIAIDDVYSHVATRDFTQSYTQPLNIKSMLDAVISSGDGNLGILCAETVAESRNWTHSEETYLRSLATLIGSTLVSQKRKETAEKLKVALVQAQEAAVAKSQFLATMSHEIRTPMNGVLGMLELVELEQLTKPIEKKVAIAKSSAHSLLGVINDILDFSKVEAGKVELEHIHFNARDLIGEVAEAQALTAQEKGIEIILDLVSLEPSHLMGDPGRIRQVITNLISNAVKFTSQGEVVVSASIEKTDQDLLLNIKVKDSGIGITKAKQQQLFTPFSQVDASTTREYGGTGLGLAICKQLCELMNGNISLVSEPGQGSEFTAIMQVAEGVQKERTIPNVDMRSLNVLVVDDNETNRLVISQQLGHWGAKVTLASSAMQALELCAKRIEKKQAMFDIAVLDMQMPEMDGMELCKLLKAHDDYKAMPLVMMTSIAGMEGAQRFSEIGFQAYFPKPVTTADLISALSVITSSDSCEPLPLVTPGYISSLRKERSDKPVKILLVEDNPVNQHVSTLMLKKLKCEVVLTQNGQEAINTLSEHNKGFFDLVLMDCQMPVMDGFEATSNIREGMAGEEHKDIKIIALTANAMESDKERCIKAGMDDYLTKPIELDILKDKIEQYF